MDNASLGVGGYGAVMETALMFVRIILLSAAVGAGARLGWEAVPFLNSVASWLIAIPVWLWQLARFHWRGRI